MRTTFCGFWIVGALLVAITAIASADDANGEAINKDRKLIEGTWRIVALEVNGNKSSDEDAKKLTVVNGPDGTWTILSEGRWYWSIAASLWLGERTSTAPDTFPPGHMNLWETALS